MDFNAIKLIIWDLDETLWRGVLSEQTVTMSEDHIQLIKNMVDRGVMNSICSKNDEQPVYDVLTQLGIKELFVFNSINWSPKGERVKQIVSEMNLRQPNVMFIDDNPSNRGEVKAVCPDIDVEDVDIIPQLIDFYSVTPLKDREHKRLNQYQVLETKQNFKASFASNEEFLKQSNIIVRIGQDCNNHKERILDLINRSNQLNFTKIRLSPEELEDLLDDQDIQCGYVEVKDNFGDYGIVGFYAISNGDLKHFVFSCRTLGMGVEQYVYKCLGSPRLIIVGEVSSSPYSPDPFWINQDTQVSKTKEVLNAGKVLIKGPCDMSQMFAYISDNEGIITEFVYVNDRGVSIESANHTSHIVQSLSLDKETKQRLSNDLPFGDDLMYETHLFDEDVDFAVLSLFTDPNLGLYKEKKTGAIVAFGEYTNDLTNELIWDSLIGNEVFTANCKFTKEQLKKIKNDFEFMGRISPEQVIDNLTNIYDHIQKGTHLILILGSETEYLKNTQPAYKDRHAYNKVLNSLVKEWSEGKERIHLINVNDYIEGQNSFTNNINHFVRVVYYKMSQDIVGIINSNGEVQLKQNSKVKVIIKEYCQRFVEKFDSLFKRR